MAKRIATEYVNVNLTVTEAEMPKLISICHAEQLRLNVFVMGSGNPEMVLADDSGSESIKLVFAKVDGGYRCSLSGRVTKPKLADALRKLVSSFKGDAVVNRIYQGFTMVYHYIRGAVVRIVECVGTECRTVFEYKDSLGMLEARYRLRLVEEEIDRLRGAVNELLDLRNSVTDGADVASIDERLKYHSRMLFALEA